MSEQCHLHAGKINDMEKSVEKIEKNVTRLIDSLVGTVDKQGHLDKLYSADKELKARMDVGQWLLLLVSATLVTGVVKLFLG